MKYNSISKPAFLVLILLTSACKKEIKTEYILKINLYPFDSTKIFDADYISDYNFDLNEANIDSIQKISKKHFLTAIDLFKNKKNPKASIPYFRKSIYLFPEPKTYFELANAMLETKEPLQIDLASRIYYVLERLNFKPKSNLEYLHLVVNYYDNIYDDSREEKIKIQRNEDVINLMIRGLRNGDYDLAKVQADERINFILKNPYFTLKYNEFLASNLNDEKKGSYDPFNEFVSLFPKIQGTFITTTANPNLSNYTNSIPYSFSKYIPEMENTSFGREVSNDFFYVVNLKNTDTYTALLYKSVSFWGSYGAPVYIMLATYNIKGEQLSKVMFSCDCSYTKFKTATFQNDVISISDYERIWQKPLKEYSVEENSVKEIKLTSNYALEINSEGIIVEQNTNKTYADSTIITKL